MQDKAAFIFCVEDRALFCQDCDDSIHSASSLSANHQRFLATGIRVALSSSCSKDTGKVNLEPPSQNGKQSNMKAPTQQPSGAMSSWAVDDLLQFSDFESSEKVCLSYPYRNQVVRPCPESEINAQIHCYIKHKT